MKLRNVLLGAALVLSTAAITTQVVSQDKPNGGMPQMSPEQMQDMEKWMKFATPGEHHQILQKKVGKWNGVMKHWMAPDAPAMESTFTAEIKPMYDGRYVHETVEGEGMMPGHTFHGQSWVGYDNIKQKFFWTWIDNMGTGVMNAEGTFDPATKTFKYTYEHPEPSVGKYLKGRSVEKWVNDNQMTSEMYGTDKAGKEIKMMEMTLTRAK